MTKLERCTVANDYHASGFNCAQSVLAAFTAVTGFTEAQSIAMGSGYGGGMRYGGVCGVVSAAILVLGMAYPASRENGAEGKRRSGELTKEFQNRFIQHFANLDCRDLKANPVGEGTEMAKLLNTSHHCRMLIISGTELLHDMLSELEEK